MTDAILEVRNLSTHFFTDDGEVKAVRDVSFSIAPGETVGIVGESGCGKSVTAMSVMGLVGRPGKVVGGEIMFRGRDLLKLSKEEFRNIRGRDIAMIFQDPLSSMNPVLRVGYQIDEAMYAHDKIPKDQVERRAIDLLAQVRVSDAARRIRQFPHQFSGGMRQRAMIAMGLSNKPDLLIADEPTTALDVTVQAQILELLRDLNEQTGAAIILITHNLGVVAGLCKRVLVMYAGEIVEEGTVEQIFEVAAASVHVVAAAIRPADRRQTRTPPALHRGPAPRPHRPAPGMQVQPALPLPGGALLQRVATHRAGRARPVRLRAG